MRRRRQSRAAAAAARRGSGCASMSPLGGVVGRDRHGLAGILSAVFNKSSGLINGFPCGRLCAPSGDARRRPSLSHGGRTMIVVSGEALMDVFAAGDTPTGLILDARIGGSPLNVAIGLARLAQPVAFFGALSSGFLGERLLRGAARRRRGHRLHAARRRADHAGPGRPGRARRAELRLLRRRCGRPAAAAERAGARAARRRPTTSAPTRWWSSRWPRRSARWSSANTAAA